MEFTFVLLLFTGFCWFVYQAGGWLFSRLIRPKQPLLRRKLIPGWIWLLLLGLVSAIYLWQADRFWSVWTLLAQQWLSLNQRWLEAYFVGWFYRYYYPVLLVLCVAAAYLRSQSGHQKTFWYRLIRRFDHRKIWPFLGFWLLVLLWNLTGWKLPYFAVSAWLINLAVFYSLVYAAFGFLTVLYGLKRAKVAYRFSSSACYALIVLPGPYFIVTLCLFMGIGISDIWMDYRKMRRKKQLLE